MENKNKIRLGTILSGILGINAIKNLFFVTKYRKLLVHEAKHWVWIIIYATLYFSIEAYATSNNIEFYIWDTALTASIFLLVLIFGNFFCGKACFLSRFQDFIDFLGRFLLRGKYNNFISQNTRAKLKWLKYIVFVISLAIPLGFSSYKLFIDFFGLFFGLGFLF
jgi:polyferredoxin